MPKICISNELLGILMLLVTHADHILSSHALELPCGLRPQSVSLVTYYLVCQLRSQLDWN